MSIFDYTDYRLLLSDKFKALQKEGLSYRKFSALAGFSSPNFLQLITQGKRNLSLEGSQKIAFGLKLNAKETEFFQLLVRANQSKDIQEKKELTEKLIKFKALTMPKKDNISDYEYYRHWYNIPIREAFLISRSKPLTAKALSQAFWPKLGQKEAQESIKLLLDLKFIKKDSRGKFTISTDETLMTKDFIVNSLIISFHMKMLDLAKESIMEIKSEERELGGVTVALSKQNFEKMRDLIKEFKARALQIAEEDKNKQDVYQVGFQLFPLTKGLHETD